MRKFFAILLSILLGLFTLAACSSGGGGGGGGGGGTAYDYKAALFGADESFAFSSLLGINVPGTMFANSTSGSLTYNTLQSPIGPGDSGSANLDIDQYGLANITEPGEDDTFGAATPDASVFFAVESIQTLADEGVNMLVGINRASGMGNSDLDGTFTCAELNSDGSNHSVNILQVEMYGDGTFLGPPGAGTYSVSSDGSLTFTAGGGSVKGAARQGGDVFIISFNDPDDLGFILCVLDNGGHALTDLDGHYRIGIMEVPDAPGAPSAFLGELYLDGVGSGSFAPVTNSSGFIASMDRELDSEVAYIVNGSGMLETTDNRPIVVTPSGDFFMIIDDDDNDGSTELNVATLVNPQGAPAEAYIAAMAGPDNADLTAQFFSANTGGMGLAPGTMGTLDARTLWTTGTYFEASSTPYMVNSIGIMELASQKTVWGFANATSGTFLMGITDQSSDSFVNVMLGQETTTGLTNATATGIYNCVGLYGADSASVALDIPGALNFDGAGKVNTTDDYYVADNGLITISLSGDLLRGVIRSDEGGLLILHKSEASDDSGLYVCIEDPYRHTNLNELNDSYIVVIFEIGSGGPVMSSIAQFDFSGDGTGDVTVLYDDQGEVGAPTPDTNAIGYTVNAGNFETTDGDPIYVTSSGDAFVTGISGDPEIFVFGIRK